MAIWKCPECGGTKIKAYEWNATRVEYNLDAPQEDDGWDFRYNTPGDEASILMAACCAECTHELTDDELALVAKSISGLVLSGHPHLPVDPNSIKGYIIVNPEHFSGTPVTLGWDDSYVWPNYEEHLRQMFLMAKDNDNEYLYVGMVLKAASFTEIAGKYIYCEECGEVYEATSDKCPECEVWAGTFIHDHSSDDEGE